MDRNFTLTRYSDLLAQLEARATQIRKITEWQAGSMLWLCPDCRARMKWCDRCSNSGRVPLETIPVGRYL